MRGRWLSRWWLGMIFCGMLAPAWGRTWYTLPPPAPNLKQVMVTLLDGGDIWIGYRDYGLVRMDFYGTIQKSYTPANGLPGPTVTGIVRVGNDLWVGTADGLAFIDEGGTIKAFTADHGLPDNGVTCLATRDGELFVGTMRGLARYRGGSFDVWTEARGLPTDHITGLCDSPLGMLVTTTKGWAIIRGSGIDSHTMGTDADLPCEWFTCAAYYKYRRFGSTADDWIVLGTAGEGLYLYNDRKYTSLRAADPGLAATWITCLAYEPVTERLWVGTKEGLAIKDVKDGPWELVTSANSGLVSDAINHLSLMAIDHPIKDYEPMNASGQPQLRGGWGCACATCTQSIARPPIQPCKAVCYAPIVHPTYRVLHVIQTWAGIATDEGANVFFEKNLPHYGQGNFYTYLANMGWRVVGLGVGERVYAAVHPPGALTGFLFAFVPPKVEFVPDFPRPPAVRFPSEVNVLVVTHDGRPAVGGYKFGRGGLAILTGAENGSWSIYDGDAGLRDANVTALYQDKNTLLIGTGGLSDGTFDFRTKTGTIGSSGNLYRWRDGRIESFPREGLPFSTPSSMFRSAVTAICADNDKIYVGTNGDGVYIFDGVSWTRWETLSTKGLSSDFIQALAVRDGILYVGSKKGLDCFGPGFCLHTDITSFGAYSNEVEALLFDDSEGDESKLVLWVGHRNGLLRISTEEGVMVHGGKPRDQGMGSMAWPSRGVLSSKTLVGWAWPGNPNEGGPDVCPFDGLPGNHVYALAYDDLNLWIATDNGIGRLRK